MIDGIIKADGTSRLIRANLPATYEEFRAQAAAGTLPLDVLFNASGWSQMPTFLNKANLLKDSTASTFGLGTDAVPDDVFTYLGQYSQYWWRRKALKSVTKYYESNVAFSSKYSSYFRVNDTGGTLYVADSVTFNENTGKYTLVNPTVCASGTSYSKEYDGKYLHSPDGRIRESNSNEDDLGAVTDILYVTDYSMTYGSQSFAVYKATKVSVLGAASYLISTGETQFVHSTDRNAYQDYGKDSEFEHEYLGVPFDNAVYVPKIEVITYVGTGKYGSSSPNSVTFSFPPKVVFAVGRGAYVAPYSDVDDNCWSLNMNLVTTSYTDWNGLGGEYNGAPKGKKSADGKTLYWYHSGNGGANYQLNTSGVTYSIVGLG